MNRIFHKRIKKKRTGLFWRTLVSYAIVLLLPILICSFYYFHSYHALKERNRTNQHLILENFAEQINSAFRDAVNLGSHLQLNKYVAALSNNKSTMNSTPPMDRYYLKKDLASLQVSNSLIQRINLYFPGSEYVVNSASTFSTTLFPFMESKSYSLSGNDWASILDGLQTERILCYGAGDKNFITVAEALLTDISGQPLSILAIQIDKKNLQNRLQNSLLLESPCSFALISGDGPLLSTGTSDIRLSGLPFEELAAAGPESSVYEIQAEEELIIDYYPLQIPGTALISVTKKADYQAQTAQLLKLMLLTILFCVLIGIVVIMYYSRKNYEPVSQILQFIKDTDESMEPEKNEFHFIMKILSQSRNEIERQRKLLKNNYMQKIFSGEIVFDQIPEQVAEQFSLNLTYSSVCVVLFHVDKTGSFNEPDNVLDLTTFTVENVFQELLSERFPDTWFSNRGAKISVLIHIPEQTAHPLEQIEQLTRQLLEFLKDSFQLSLRAGISSIQQQKEIPDAYLQADTALEYQRLFETGSICCYETIPQKQLIGSIPLNTSEYVINLVVAGNQAQITDYFRMLDKNMEKCILSWADAQSCFYFFYQATAKLQLYCQTHYGLQLDALAFLDEDFFSQSLPKALARTQQAYLAASEELAEKSKNPSYDHWGKDICRFIENNYFDANINLNTVAEYFHISPAYLSKKFRDQYQKSLIDYLYEVRISNSVALLKETDLKIADIAQMTGFVDSNAFIRIFKKLKGTTPGKYKGSGN